MSDSGAGDSTDALAGEPDGVLRAKYLDYCSAQVADILLTLSPDEMYVLAQDAARESGLRAGSDWEEIVALATARVSARLGLPTFEEWAEEYRRDPARFDPYLMGLWHDEVERSSTDS